MYKGAEIISRMVEATGVKNQEALCRLLKIKSASLSPYKKRDWVPQSWIDWLEATEDISSDFLLRGDGPMKKTSCSPGGGAKALSVPLVGSRHGRKGGFQPLPESENWPRFDAGWLAGQAKDVSRLLLLKFSGLHMAPEIQDGDLVLFDQGRMQLDTGKLYAVRIEEAITAHRIVLGAGVLTLRSENRDYPDQTIKRELLGSPQFEVLGKVLGVFRLYF